MKKILLFTLISALLATSMASCKVEPKEDEVGNDEVIEDEVIEDEVIEDEMVKESEAKTVDGIPKELYDTYGFSVIHPEKDDYSYIRINFDESREISGYSKLGIGYAFGEDIGYIDSNGAFYSGLPEGGKYSYLRDWQDAEVPDIEGVDAVAASPYGGNLLMFAKDGKYGYLNTDGEIVIEAQFYEARPFSDGLAAVCREYGDCLEYINESGETALKFEDANGYYNIFQMSDEEPSCDFSDGVALVYCGNEGFCIDKQGNRLNVKNPVGMHKQGRIAFYDEETKLYGFADKYGNIVIPAVYHGVFDFSQSGIALVKSTRNYNIPEEAQKFEVANYYRGYIDTEGNVVIPIEFEQPWWYYGTKGLIEPFESYGVVSLYKQGYIYYYRYDGTLLGKIPRMAYVRYEDESYKINVAEYWQWVNDGKDGASKEETEHPKYNVIYTPSDETPAVSPEELQVFCDRDAWRYGYQTEDEEIIIPAIFSIATEFSEGLAAVCRGYGEPLEYIDASGKTILTVEGIDGMSALDYYGFYPTCSFSDSVAVIYDDGFCIDKTGNILNIKEPEGMYKYGLIAVRDPETKLIGYADIEGNIVIPGKYADVRDFEPQGVALVFSKEHAMWPDGYETPYCGYINTKGEEIIPLEYYAGPNSGASIIHPIHREVDGMIELYKDGYYHYFTYDGTLVEKRPEPRLEDDEEPLTYKLVEPTYTELQKIRSKLGIISATFSGDYNCKTDDMYQKLFCWGDLQDYYIPIYDDEITQYISKPMHTNNDYVYWDKVIYENDPLGKFGEIPSEVFDENGIFDDDRYFNYWQKNGNIPTAGYNLIDGAFFDWLVEGVWNGKIDHDAFFEFEDTTKLYYYEGNYYCRWTEGGRGGGVFFSPVLYDVIELDDYKYEVHFVNMDDSDKPAYYTTMVVGMKEASNGFRFWSIYSIKEEIIKDTEKEPLSYTQVYPTEQELDEIHEKLNTVFSTFLKDYDSNSDNPYEKLFEYNELNYFYIPEYEDEIIKYIAKPYYTRNDGVNFWHVIVDNRDPQLEFGEIPDEVLDKHRMLDMDLYSQYSDRIGDDFGFTLSGYYTYDAGFIDWLVEGVWNGKVDHETVFKFSDKETLYYCQYNDNYYTRRFEMGRGGGVFYETKILEMTELDGYRYELKLDVLDSSDEHACFATAVVGMKESSNGFRFWSIYSIDYENSNDTILGADF